jgi:hypothetical protein
MPLLSFDRWNYLSNGQQYLSKLFYGKGETQRKGERIDNRMDKKT